MSLRLELRSAAATQRLGEKLGRLLRPGDLVALKGELGAGKTCLVQGLARALGVKEPVLSPSFLLLREYRGRDFPLYHFDAYRLQSPQEFLELGLEEYFPFGVSVIEWAERVEDTLPAERLEVQLDYVPGDPEARLVTVTGHGSRGKELLEALRDALSTGT
ncbi:tRNA (adenosine(37)-N6)-threonylcarbamoyltransferase complex ATPase subunit type 1 TsaE [Desulfothermobacter acidiphilus]|uniref:tRNA (adenosine(37)-N6)-threonylcarbamoyltransferase complex ATPase subunit type 1 TsaE n=1 Tax=Desulfothermobacter acidiphilus TaxID=1938353 RepID=UPI003F8B02B0